MSDKHKDPQIFQESSTRLSRPSMWGHPVDDSLMTVEEFLVGLNYLAHADEYSAAAEEHENETTTKSRKPHRFLSWLLH